MQITITKQDQKRRIQPPWFSPILIILIIILFVNSCKLPDEPSDDEIEQIQKKVLDIRASLYTPDNAELLDEKLYYGSNPELYPGCVSGEIYLAYSSPETFREILKEYHTNLFDSDWELSPDYSHNNEGIDVLQAGPQTLLFIASHPIRPDILAISTLANPNRQEGTIYYIQLLYYEPSVSECKE